MRQITVHGRRYRLRSTGQFLFNVFVFFVAVIGVCFLVIGIFKGDRREKQAGPAAPSDSASPSKAAAEDNGTTPEPNGSSEPESGGHRADDWRLTLVNAKHPLPDGFTVETRPLPNGLTFDTRAYDDLMEMIEAGQAQGLDFVVCSAYRTTAKQQELYDNKVTECLAQGMTDEQARASAVTVVAAPGTSEHNLGLAVDIVAFDYQQLDEGILDTPEYQWLKSHCQEYGFILRYPEGKSEFTGVIFEPWHFRYVGREAAAEIMGQGLCLEEYLGEAD